MVRDQEHNIGDIIDIAYENAYTETLVKYINVTRLSYIECLAVKSFVRDAWNNEDI